MPFDSKVMSAVAAELGQKLPGGRISKIYQPDAAELALLVYAGGKNYRLLLSANPRFARLHLTGVEKRNPPAPPTFCMLMRKYLDGGRILAVRQEGRERICRITVSVTDELGNPAEFTLVAEVMGKHSNIVLLNPQGRIVDAIRRVTEEVNRYRELLPGLPYVAPPPMKKLPPDEVTPAHLAAADPALPAWQALLDQVDGLSPILAREAVARAYGGAGAAPLHAVDPAALVAAARELAAADQYQPCLLLDPQGRLKDFHVLNLISWPGRVETGFDSVSACLDGFYGRRELEDRFGALQGSLGKLVRDAASRVSKKLALQSASREKAENAEAMRIQGELITAHLWQINRGDTAATLVNYYDPDGGSFTVALDPALTPAENAQAYYRRYQKARSGLAAIHGQIEASRAELAYLEQVDATLAEATSLPDLEEIRRELQAEGYLSERKERRGGPGGRGGPGAKSGPGGRGAPGGKRGTGGKGKAAPNEEKAAPPLTVASTDGLEIWIGRNNRQNDYLTMKLAAPHDLWFHTKEIAGAHVILRVQPGRPVAERAIHEAAALAAWHSKGRDSAAVPVDYTLRKHVRKPAGARPGMVIYEHQKTLWVTPDPELNPILRKNQGGDQHGTGTEARRDAGGDSLAD